MGEGSLGEYGALVGRVCCGPLRSLCYLIVDLREGEAALVDAGCPAEEVLGALDELGVELRLILLTHTHFDHVAGVEEIRRLTGARAVAHRADVEMLPRYWGWGGVGDPPEVEPAVEDGSEFAVGRLRVRALHTPGHTPGSVCYLLEAEGLGLLFTGDTVFAGAVGRTDFAGGDERAMRESLRRLLRLPDRTVILPGHGSETTLGAERPFLESLVRR